MSDELERLENALRASTPHPSAEARTRAMDAAKAAFEIHHQGNRRRARQKGQVSEIGTSWPISWLRRFTVPISRPALALAAAAFVVVASVVFYQTVLDRPAFSPGLTTVELADQTDLSTSLPAPESTSQLRVEPTSPPVETAPPEIKMMTEAEVAEVMERIAPRSPAEPADVATELSPSPEPADLAAELSPSPELEIRRVEMVREQAHAREQMAARRSRTESRSPSAGMSPDMKMRAALAELSGPRQDPSQGRDRFSRFDANPVKVTAEEPVSTFSIDVDTASYGFVRASLQKGVLPQQDAVRTEELVNYFPYDYAPPDSRETPFAAHVSLMPAPWNEANRLLHVGIKGYVADRSEAPRANLVFLIDTSGSMNHPDKLPLLISSLKLLVSTLAPDDTVAIVTYAGSAGMALAPTPAAERGRIVASLERLGAGGSTAGAEGIRQAYLLAGQHFVEDGINRVILATDGDFNVGITDPDELESYIARKRDGGVFLSVLGFGMGNYNDELMQRLAQNGNGNAAYIDSLSEARKVLVEEATSTLFPIAKDVKIQVEFNPAAVSEYRLIGYETRMLRREDFRNDKVDAGEIGVGHTVTAIYEVTPVGSGAERVAPLRYQEPQESAPGTAFEDEMAYLKIRYKLPDGDTSTEVVRAVTRSDAFESVNAAPQDARFAAAVAAFGQLLRGGPYTGDFGYDDVIALAQSARGDDPFGYRTEFVSLVRLAQSAAALAPLPR